MNCSEAEVYVSSLYDGEAIPPVAAQHILQCEACRRTLNEYSRMGAELRLAAATDPIQPTPFSVPLQRNRFGFLWQRVTVPRLALAGLIACIMLSLAAIPIMHAQSKPLWFQFGYAFTQTGESNFYTAAKEGYDDTQSSLHPSNGSPVATALRVKVERISNDDVVLRCRALPAKVEVTPTGFRLGRPERDLSLEDIASVHYKPGDSLTIPIEGGGTVFLKGNIVDHQPKIAFGLPLELPADEMVVRSPVLTVENRLLGAIRGASASASHEAQVVRLQTVSEGVFTFALQQFPGAVQGQANWGELTFKLDGKDYLLVAAAPITGGDQPRPVWVRRDMQSDWASSCPSVCLGSGPIPKADSQN